MSNDKRGKKIALIAHCILNQNSRAYGLAEKTSIIAEIVNFLAKNDISIIQMPCPEIAYAGVLRQTKTKEQYDNAFFRKCCKKIAKELAVHVWQYERHGVKLKLVIGIKGSPTCSVDDSGIFIEELCSELNKKGISAPFCNIHTKSLTEDIARLKELVKN